jgi:guanine deaminase
LRAFRGAVLHLLDDPAVAGPEAVAFHPDGLLLVADGHVVGCGAHDILAPNLGGAPVTSFPGRLITPGFIDLHIHFPQVDVIAAHGLQLLDWLDRHVFPAEARYADIAHATDAASFFVAELLRNGTTTAMVFGSSHRASVDALFEAALERNMRLIAGKSLMDRNAPDAVRDTVESGRRDMRDLIARWSGRGRLGYAVTPRFAITSSDAQLAMAGDVLRDHPETWMQTHLAENLREVGEATALFPDARDYLDVYARFGLVGPRSVFAHCIHLDDGSLRRMARAGASIAFCPTSNLFLGSGLFALDAARALGVKVGIGTDVGAGTTFSILDTLAEAYKVGQLRGSSLDPFVAFYLATLGGARALGLGDRIGSFAPGKEADFVVVDPGSTPLLARRMAHATTLAERLFALMVLADDRVVERTYLAGVCRHDRGAVQAPGSL